MRRVSTVYYNYNYMYHYQQQHQQQTHRTEYPVQSTKMNAKLMYIAIRSLDRSVINCYMSLHVIVKIAWLRLGAPYAHHRATDIDSHRVNVV